MRSSGADGRGDEGIPPGLAEGIEEYALQTRRFLAGEIAADAFKAMRVPRGVYEQRRDGTFMLRVRLPGGAMSGGQMRELGALGLEFGNGLLHVTTRQDIQLHDLSIRYTPAVMRRLMAAGLTSVGACGDTVRNVTACAYAGVCPAEIFDVTPCAQAAAAHLPSLAFSSRLPRKFKIAFSGCSADCALAGAADLGFIAEARGGAPGFRVMAGGGMGAHSRPADPLLEWSPAGNILRTAEAVLRLFDRLGDRENRRRARLRFVLERIGADAFRGLFAGEAEAVARGGAPAWRRPLPLVGGAAGGAGGRGEAAPAPPPSAWLGGVRAARQRQPGYVAVPLHPPLGLLTSADAARLGALASRFSGEGGVRATIAQKLLLRFVKEEELPALAAGLAGLDTDLIAPGPIERFVACAGADTCRIGICLSRDAARACADALRKSGVRRGALDAMRFHINGCPNSCGRQPLGPIGFRGVARRVGGRAVQAYLITLGGRCDSGGAAFGAPAGELPAAALPAFVSELAADFEAGRAPGESFADYYGRVGMPRFEAIISRHAAAARDGLPLGDGPPAGRKEGGEE